MPEGIPPEQITYEWFGENYQFTEDDTDGLSLEALESWPLIRLARQKAAETRQGQDARLQSLTEEAHQPRQLPFSNGMRTPGSG